MIDTVRGVKKLSFCDPVDLIYVQVPEKLDAIIIGSGIGGLCTAAIMSKVTSF